MSGSLLTTIRDLARRRGRERRGLALAEGVRLVEEALAAGMPVRGAAVSPALEGTPRGQALKTALARAGACGWSRCAPAELDALADTEHPQGVVAVVEPRVWSLADVRRRAGRRGPRARRGAGPRQRRHHAPDRARARGRRRRGAQGHGRAHQSEGAPRQHGRGVPAAGGLGGLPMRSLGWAGRARRRDLGGGRGRRARRASAARRASRPPLALVLGNEGAGVERRASARRRDRRVAIPLAPGVESLNVAVAAGILLYEVTRDA